MRVALVWTMAAVLATHTLFISACGGSQTAPPPPTVGTPPYAIAAVPNSVKFSNVPIGTYATQTVQLINKGTNALTITNVNVTGLGFGVAGFTGAPIPAGQQSTIDVIFAPNATIQANGTLSVATRELTSPLLVSLSGTGEQATGATGPLGISPLAIDFGSSPDGTQQTQQVQLTNTGNADMTVSQVSVIVGQDVFTVSGFTPGTVPAGQSTAFTVAYTAVGGTRNGLILINAAVGSTAIDAAIPLAGTGNHWVSLTWDSSSSDVVGYNLYRADATSPNIYVKMNPSLIAAGSGNTIVDNMVISGHTYYYVATAVDSSGQESGYSNKATAIIPSP